jgi:hypothetical protein
MRVPLAIRIVCSILFAASAVNARTGEVSGPFANRVLPTDVVQINAAIAKNLRISHNVKKIEAVRPDKVVVQTTARTAVDEDTTYEFNVYKRTGGWAIDTDSIQITIEKRDLRTNGPTFIR